jgi:hypothetical protein
MMQESAHWGRIGVHEIKALKRCGRLEQEVVEKIVLPNWKILSIPGLIREGRYFSETDPWVPLPNKGESPVNCSTREESGGN